MKITKGKKQCRSYLGCSQKVSSILEQLAQHGLLTEPEAKNAQIVIQKDYEHCYDCSGGEVHELYLQWEEDFTDAEIEKQKAALNKQKDKAKARRARDYKRLKKEFENG